MKKIFFPVLLFSALLLLNACKNHSELNKADSTFYLIRPAEHHSGFNGHLNWYGKKRVPDLKHFFKDSALQKIYTGPFAHSQETVDSVKTLLYPPPVEYHLGSVADSILFLLKKNKDFGKKILIEVSLPAMDTLAGMLGREESQQFVSGMETNTVLVIRNKKGKVSASVQKYSPLAPLKEDSTRKD